MQLKSGYVRLRREDGGWREKKMELTAAGRQYMERVMGSLFQMEKNAVGEMGEENLRIMTAMVIHYGKILEAEISKLREERGHKRNEADR